MRLAHRGFFFGEITLTNERSFWKGLGPWQMPWSFPQKHMAISGPKAEDCLTAMPQHPFEDILPDRS